MNKFVFFSQNSTFDCGAACLKMIAYDFGINLPYEKILSLFPENEYTSLKNIIEASQYIGLTSFGVKTSLDKLIKEDAYPCIIHWNTFHFTVLYDIEWPYVYVADPAVGLVKYTVSDFLVRWIGLEADEKMKKGIALLFSSTHQNDR